MAKRNSLILLLLMLVFAAPGSIAYLCYTHPQWLGTATTNRGALLTPPVQFVKMNANGKWRLILWNPGNCSKRCLQQLDKLARIRLALGRRLYDVEQWLIVDNKTTTLPPSLMNLLKEQDIRMLRLPEAYTQPKVLTTESQVFIANPSDYLILKYALDAKSDAIFHDIKHLLSVERKNG
ncbi:hypothetical protein [Legionella cardiaca]|uniref:Transmembrane protein n=1 Tax=Legionella cardiaca TaxID=1071983 RepID=A0ABY8AV15_9GAMM|nr:hypothetical protein [Legionella cardiaca]WED43591.1 hypothetical protein PXX05_02100 [Legionella cardiaca]